MELYKAKNKKMNAINKGIYETILKGCQASKKTMNRIC
jgi:hypothetical protein